MAEQRVTFVVRAALGGQTTLDKMDFLCEAIQQLLESEQVMVEGEVLWHDTRLDEGGG